jgi:hypothetical protein
MQQVLSVAAATRNTREVNANAEAEAAFDPSKARPLKQLKIGSLFKKYQEQDPEVKRFNTTYGDVFKIPEESKQVYAMKGFDVNKDRFFDDYQKQYNIRLGLLAKARGNVLDEQYRKIRAGAAATAARAAAYKGDE